MFLRKMKPFIFVFSILTLIVGAIPFFISKPQAVDCPIADRNFLANESGHITCVQDSAGKIWFVLKSTQNSIHSHYAKLKPEAFPLGVKIETLTNDRAPLNFQIQDGEIQSSPPHTSTAEGHKMVLSGFFSSEDLQKGVTILPSTLNSTFVFRLSQVESKVKTEAIRPGLANGDSRYSLGLVSALMMVLIILYSLQYVVSKQRRWGILALSACFILGFINFERAYRGMSGYIDKGDDTYYIAFVQSHLRDHDLFKCDSNVDFSHMEHVPCKGLPGLPLMLEPGIFLYSLLKGQSIYGDLNLSKLRFMRVWGAFYAFLATVFIFLLLHEFGISFLNIIFGAALIWGTSLSKWTYERVIFTHAVELFLLSMFLYVLVLKSKAKIAPPKAMFLCGLLNGLLIMIRAEYWMLACGLIPLFLFADTPSRVLRNLRSKTLSLVTFVLGCSPFAFFYVYFTFRTQSDYAKGGGALILTSLMDLLNAEFYHQAWINITSVLVDFWAAGVLLFFGFFTMAYSIFKKRIDSLLWLSLIFSASYFIVLSLYHTPLGYEWQHRYFLKLYPFAFMVIMMNYYSLGRVFRSLTWVALMFSLVKEYFANEAVLADSFIAYEPVKYFMTDAHLFFHGFDFGFYGNYLLGYFLLFFGFIISMSLNYKKKIPFLQKINFSS